VYGGKDGSNRGKERKQEIMSEQEGKQWKGKKGEK
jgi:hypothetical protein